MHGRPRLVSHHVPSSCVASLAARLSSPKSRAWCIRVWREFRQIGIVAPLGLGRFFLALLPRAAPWAIEERPFGAKTQTFRRNLPAKGESVRRGGRVSIIGVYGPPWNLIDVGAAMNKGLTIKTGQCDVKRYMPHLLEHIRNGNIDPRALITHRVPLEAAAEMYRVFAARTDGILKCVLVPRGAK